MTDEVLLVSEQSKRDILRSVQEIRDIVCIVRMSFFPFVLSLITHKEGGT